ncbi:NTP transferase domain-containing protein [Halococcus thailandensis]|uniref:GTP:adenosylcobinamide-phosphateguanylyltransfer ase n=1 Tax=Halococcus thailandensis JCM 13552 TaxID=1227457 RepID=M0N164_9EURY|nr:NTP transferase domain-containing protein [Halococcus thailandensis]EMA51576.1 GTP:adenosylcobinamide-phosphateguanylyltransfer ase [Halococcus thailandensis JCM 13552]
MCGGRGTRLDTDVEKPLYRVDGLPMLDRVRTALVDSCIESIRYVVSPHTPRTREHLDRDVVEAPGEGYVGDLQYALARSDPPILTVATDLPLLDGAAVDRVLDSHDTGSLTVAVPAACKRRLGVSVGTTMEVDGETVAPSGINIVGEDEGDRTIVIDDERFAVNVNHPSDAAVAEALLQ